MNIAKLRDKSVAELQQVLQQKCEALLKLRFSAAAQELKQTHLFKMTRKVIARINTILVERQNEKAKE